MNGKFLKFVDRLANATNQSALCEAVKKGYAVLCEGMFDDNDRAVAAVCIASAPEKDKNGNPGYLYRIADRHSADKLVGRFPELVDIFDQEFDFSGEGIDIGIEHHGVVDPSWDGRDFATYDPGSQDDDTFELLGDPRSYVETVVGSWLANEQDMMSMHPEKYPDGETEKFKADVDSFKQMLLDAIVNDSRPNDTDCIEKL